MLILGAITLMSLSIPMPENLGLQEPLALTSRACFHFTKFSHYYLKAGLLEKGHPNYYKTNDNFTS